MFKQILDQSNLDSDTEKKLISQIIQKQSKNPSLVLEQLRQNFLSLKPIFLRHWKQSYNFIFTFMSKHSAYQYLSNDRKNCLSELLSSINIQTGHEKAQRRFISKLYQRFNQVEKCMVIANILAQHTLRQISADSQQDILSILPTFVRITAMSIQNYLTLKNEPAKSEKDRIQTDLCLIQNCQKWISQSYFKLVESLASHQVIAQSLRPALLVGLCQIIGALLQAMRQNNLNNDILARILSSFVQYALQRYSLEEISRQFLGNMRKNSFYNPLAKIQIPQMYTSQMSLNTCGYCYVILQSANRNSSFYNSSKLLQYILPALSQSLPLPFKFKEEIQKEAKKLLLQAPKGADLIDHISNIYPLGLLLFNLHYFAKQQYEGISCLIGLKKVAAQIIISNLNLLSKIKIDNLQAQKSIFIVSIALDLLQNQEKNVKSEAKISILLLIKGLKLNFVNEEYSNSIVQFVKRVCSSCGQTAVKKVMEKCVQQRQQNQALCLKIQKQLEQFEAITL